jgi:hypothetical protein
MHITDLTNNRPLDCSIIAGYPSITRFYYKHRINQEGVKAFSIKPLRKSLLGLFICLYYMVFPFCSSARENADTLFTYIPFKVVNPSLLKKVTNNKTGAIALQLQNEVLNAMLDKRPSTMRFRLPVSENSSINLILKRSDILAAGLKPVIGTDSGDEDLHFNFCTYLGSVENTNESWASLSYSDSAISGIVIIGDKTYHLSPSSIKGNFSPGTYTLTESETMNSGQLVQSGDGESLLPSQLNYHSSPISLKNTQFLDTLTVKVAIESDYETYAFFGNNSESATTYLLSLFAAVSQIYESEVGIKLQVSFLRVWTTPDDPYSSDTYDGNLLITEFENYWNAKMQDVDRNIALFFTKRFPTGSGMGFGLGMVGGSLCDKSTYTFVNQGWEGDYDINTSVIYIAAHELGHNFHSPHTHDCVWPIGPDSSLGPIDSCSSNCTGFIEYSTAGTIMSYCGIDQFHMTFHPLTRSLIRITAENALCIGSGAMESFTVKGRVTVSGIGLEGAVISANWNGPTIASTSSDVNGNYSLNLPAESYNIDCRKENYAIMGPSGPNHAYGVIVKDVNNLNFIAEATPKDAYEPDDEPNLAKQIYTEGAIQYHTIHNGFDADFIKFTAQNGESYSIGSYPGENGWAFSLSLLSFELLDTDFTTQLIYSFGNPHIEWSAPGTGTYYIKVQGTTGPYGISVSNAAFIDASQQFEDLDWSKAAWGDYDNDGDKDLIISGGTLTPRMLIYRNDNGTFVDIHAPFPNMLGSVEWGDFDSDGNLDILFTGYEQIIVNSYNWTHWITKIYRNNQGTFEDIGAAFPEVYSTTAKWGDCDNDGDLDILLMGRQEIDGKTVAYLYRNDAGNFVAMNLGIEGTWGGSAIFGDYDTDGDLDIMVTGATGNSSTDNPISRIYRNDNGVFNDIHAALEDLSFNNSAEWGDYDNDGDLDLVLSGNNGNRSITKIYRNDEGGFIEGGANLQGMHNSDISWGDFDNDGYLDLAESGDTAIYSLSLPATHLYLNKEGTFVEKYTPLKDISSGAIICGDYDNDSDLDILISGINTNLENTTRLYNNLSTVTNSSPAAPQGMAALISKNSVTFSWNSATDDHTPSNGLTYNIRIGTAPGKGDIVSPMSNPITGHRLIPAFGNAWHNKIWTIHNLSSGTYYWSVQAIDNTFTGSMWAPEQSFTVSQVNKPPISNAGADQSVNEGATVSLDGSASYDPDGDPITFSWNAPAGVTLSSTTTDKPTFTAPEINKDTLLNFSLVVNDGVDNSDQSIVRISVKSIIETGTEIPGKDGIIIYPNPSNDILRIEGLQMNQKSNIAVYRMDGKLIQMKISNSISEIIDISNQVSGMYLLKINNQTFKILKE